MTNILPDSNSNRPQEEIDAINLVHAAFTEAARDNTSLQAYISDKRDALTGHLELIQHIDDMLIGTAVTLIRMINKELEPLKLKDFAKAGLTFGDWMTACVQHEEPMLEIFRREGHTFAKWKVAAEPEVEIVLLVHQCAMKFGKFSDEAAQALAEITTELLISEKIGIGGFDKKGPLLYQLQP